MADSGVTGAASTTESSFQIYYPEINEIIKNGW